MSQAQSKNMRLIAQHKLDGFGNMGEGMGLQLPKDGRRIMWLAHESPPKNFTGVDVTDIKNPKIIVQTDLPHQNVRSNSLEVCGDLLVVAYQTTALGLKPAGIDIFDISDPENPKSIGCIQLIEKSHETLQLLFQIYRNSLVLDRVESFLRLFF